MFNPSFNQPFSASRTTHMRRRRHHLTSWDTYESDTSLTPFSSCEDIHHSMRITASPSLMSTRAHERVRMPTVSPNNLPSRVNALSRRAVTLSTYLGHLSAVVEPLRSVKVDELGERDLKDMMMECRGLQEAMVAFEEQFDEVFGMMEELKSARREALGQIGGDDNWKGGRKGFL